EDDRPQAVVEDRLAQRPSGREQRVLADDVVERARAHAIGERGRRIECGRPFRCVVGEEIHQRAVWRAASYRTSAAATATFSDSTGARMGMVSDSSAVVMMALDTPDPSPPRTTAIGRRKSTRGSSVPPRGTAA